MRISYFGTYDRNRPRNRNIINGLKKNNIDVIECHYSPWGKIEDKSTIQGGLLKFMVLIRFIVAYLGHIDMLIAKPIVMLRKKPLIFDAFLSLYDTVVNDRKLSRPDGLI